jgi:hypothetical protein
VITLRSVYCRSQPSHLIHLAPPRGTVRAAGGKARGRARAERCVPARSAPPRRLSDNYVCDFQSKIKYSTVRRVPAPQAHTRALGLVSDARTSSYAHSAHHTAHIHREGLRLALPLNDGSSGHSSESLSWRCRLGAGGISSAASACPSTRPSTSSPPCSPRRPSWCSPRRRSSCSPRRPSLPHR